MICLSCITDKKYKKKMNDDKKKQVLKLAFAVLKIDTEAKLRLANTCENTTKKQLYQVK